MPWHIEYYEQEDGSQPAEEFEDDLKRRYRKLAAKLFAILVHLEKYGPALGGGYIEPCRDYSGLWEVRVIFNKVLARELFGFDGERERVVLLHGYDKQTGQPASQSDLRKAHQLWLDYEKSHKVSPEAEIEDE